MKKHDDESNSGGLEILSIGNLYTGPWDKKYWSSSRGKDRYPYPIGYQALRTYKGLTCKMEICEGLKGPLFQITSNDEQCSEETPDRALKNFQKKCCSQVKLYPGKRFSGKVDGIEFFGFKNTLVQRLLRELVATVDASCDQNSLLTNFNEASARSDDEEMTSKDPELMSRLDKSRATGKRSRTCKADAKSVRKKSSRRCQPVHQGHDAEVACSVLKTSNNNKPKNSSGSNDYVEIRQAGGPVPVLPSAVLGGNVSSPGHVLTCKSQQALDVSEVEPSLGLGQNKLASKETCTSASLVNLDMPQDKKPLDEQCIENQGNTFSVAIEGENEKDKVKVDVPDTRLPVTEDSEVNHFVGLCAPDSLDPHQGSVGQEGEQAVARNEFVADTECSEGPVTASTLGGSCNLIDSSEKGDFDSFGEDIAKSKQSVLLPSAAPVLTYASRKRRKAKNSKELHSEFKPDDKSKLTKPARDGGTHANSGEAVGEKSNLPNVNGDSITSVLENGRYFVPDSLDDDHCEKHTAILPSSGNNEAAEVASQGNHEPFDNRSSVLLDATKSFDPCNCCEHTSHCKELPNDYHDQLQKECLLEVNSALVCPSSIPLNLLASSKDNCFNVEGEQKHPASCIKNPEMETTSDGEAKKQQPLPANSGSEMKRYSAPLTESIVLRTDGDKCLTDADHETGEMVSPYPTHIKEVGKSDRKRPSFDGKGSLKIEISQLKNGTSQESFAQNITVVQEQATNCVFNNYKNAAEFSDACDTRVINPQTCVDKDKIRNQFCVVYPSSDKGSGSFKYHASNPMDDVADTKSCPVKLDDNIPGTMKLIGCYSHPVQISSVVLTRTTNVIYICVSCGLLRERERDVFLYKLSVEDPSLGSPSMVGNISLSLPLLKDEFGKEVAIDKSGLQFTPDARGLVIADSIRMPYCREKNLHCLCPQCESCCFEENALKIVNIQSGYASLMLKLHTIYPVHCVLVCEPERLLAVDESGRIYIWIMNSDWSVKTKEFVMLSCDFLPSRVIELKRVPKSSSIVIGHNGCGEFSLWDIVKCAVVSKFSAPASSVLEFLPVSLFSWQSRCLSQDKLAMEEFVRKLEEATMLSFCGQNEAITSCPMEGKDIAGWLLVYASSDTFDQLACSPSVCSLNSDGSWRLALLVNNTVILGAALPPSTAAVGTSASTGITGSRKGHVDVWNLATGETLGTLHEVAGKEVLHIAVDNSTSSVIAIAHDGGQLWVYQHG